MHAEPEAEPEGMFRKLSISLVWILIGAAWGRAVLFLIALSSLSDGSSRSGYYPARYVREGILLWVPLIVPILAIFSPYSWFPKKRLGFACWP